MPTPTEPQFRLLLPPPRVRERLPSLSKGAVRWLAVAFWSSLFGTTLAVAWTIQCGLEAPRASQRLIDAEAEGARLEAAAAKKLALAEDELSQRLKIAADRRYDANKSELPSLDLREREAARLREIEQLQLQVADAQQAVNAAKKAVDDSLIEVERITRDAWLERKQSRRLLYWSIFAATVGAVVTSATGWLRRREG
jgi:hypothetical protein